MKTYSNAEFMRTLFSLKNDRTVVATTDKFQNIVECKLQKFLSLKPGFHLIVHDRKRSLRIAGVLQRS